MEQQIPLSLEQAEEIVKRILCYGDNDPLLVEGLMELVRAIADPGGDKIRYALAEEVIRMIFPKTETCEKVLKKYLAGETLSEIEEDDDPRSVH